MTRLGTSEETGMNETPPWSAPGPWPRRRCVLTLALGVVVLPGAGVVGAQPDDPRRARPQANDRFAFARGNGKGRVITSAAQAPAGPPLTAFPLGPAPRVARDEPQL